MNKSLEREGEEGEEGEMLLVCCRLGTARVPREELTCFIRLRSAWQLAGAKVFVQRKGGSIQLTQDLS